MAAQVAQDRENRHLDLSRLLNPGSIAIVGASTDPLSISGQPLRLMLDAGYAGQLYPVNPRRSEVLGVKAYPSVAAIGNPCDVAVVAVRAELVPDVLLDCGAAGIPYAVIMTSGFADDKENGAGLQLRLERAIARSGVRVVGPNCVGVMNIRSRAYSAFGAVLLDDSLRAGPLAIVSQSGGVGQSMLAFANEQGIGTSYVISCGNEVDLSFFDFAHDLLERDEVMMVAAYMEASVAGTDLRELGRHALEVGKPILMMKVGNSAAGQRAASSHTGKLTADYALFQAAFAEGGFIEIHDFDDLADVARLVIGGRYPQGRNVGILTGSGGWGVLLADHCEKNGLVLPSPSASTVAGLQQLPFSIASAANPIDHLPRYTRQHEVLEAVIDDPQFDQLIVRAGGGTAAGPWTERFLRIATASTKPIAVSWPAVPARAVEERRRLTEAGFLCATHPGRLARAVARFTEFAVKRRQFLRGAQDPGERVIARPPLALAQRRGALSEHDSKAVLSSYGIPTTQEVVLPLADVLSLSASPIPFPLAVKLASADIAHKTEAGVVRLGVSTLDELKAAAQEVHGAGSRYAPGAAIDGILIQEMATGTEIIVGAVNDQHFGPYVMVGLGGIFAEVMRDVTHRFAPVSGSTARQMIGQLNGARILDGFRGSPPADVEALADVLVRLSWLIVDEREHIREIDVNPVLVRPRGEGAVAVDALIVMNGH